MGTGGIVDSRFCGERESRFVKRVRLLRLLKPPALTKVHCEVEVFRRLTHILKDCFNPIAPIAGACALSFDFYPILEYIIRAFFPTDLSKGDMA